MTRLGGVVLCGGRSSRMGTPKAMLILEGESLVARMTRLLSGITEAVVVVAAPEQELPLLHSAIIVRDPIAYEGPLRGIAEGLNALPNDIEAAFVTSCDAPLLKPEWVQFMAAKLGAADIALPVVEGRQHPLAAVYRRSVAGTARRLLSEQRHRPIFLCESHPTVYVPEEELIAIDPTFESLRNANTPEEFAELKASVER